jgi:hypothetical protein
VCSFRGSRLCMQAGWASQHGALQAAAAALLLAAHGVPSDLGLYLSVLSCAGTCRAVAYCVACNDGVTLLHGPPLPLASGKS